MHDGDIAGEQIRQLRQEQGRTQIAHQPFVEKGAAIFHLANAGEDCRIDRNVALAAAGGDDHVGLIEQIGVAGDACIA